MVEGRRVLVAGGAGFVGSQLVRELADQGAKVVVFDNFQTGARDNLAEVRDAIDVVNGDLLDEWSVLEAFRAYRPELVFNMAAETFVPTAFDVPKRFLRINVDGHLNLLMACRHHGIGRIVYASSAEVYGNPPPGPLNEDHPLGAANTYAVTKLAADRLCFTLQQEHGIPVVAARLFNAYGPRESEPYVIPEIIAQLHAGGPLRLGNLEARRDFTYVEDTARALVAIMKSDIEPGTAVNVGSGRTHSVREVAQALGRIFDRDVSIVVDEARVRPHDIVHLEADTTRLRERTGFRPEVDLDDGLRRTVRWFVEHGCRWPWQDRVVTAR